MSAQPMFKDNGNGYDMSPAGVVLVVAGIVYGDDTETTAEGMRKSTALLDAVLTAAHAAGYMQCDILRTLLARNQPDRRVMAMVQAACDAAGAAAVIEIIDGLDG